MERLGVGTMLTSLRNSKESSVAEGERSNEMMSEVRE